MSINKFKNQSAYHYFINNLAGVEAFYSKHTILDAHKIINMKNLFYLLALLLFAQCSSTQLTTNPSSNGKWHAVTPMTDVVPTERHEAAFVGVGDKIYLLGGRGEKPNNIYNTNTNTWSEGAQPPVEMHHLQPVVYNKKIYVMGAMTGPYPGETPIPNIYIYHPKEDRWEKSTPIPADRQRGAAGVVLYKGKMYMACGIKDGHRGDHKKWLDSFDPKTGQWETLPDAPRPRDHFQALTVSDKLYLLGGRTTIAADNPFKNTISEVDVYDFKTSKWMTLPDGLPTKRAGNYVTLVGNEILVMGGESFTQEPSHAETEALNINSHNWRTLAPMVQGRHGTGAVLIDGKIYVASGSGNRGGGPELTTLEYFSF